MTEIRARRGSEDKNRIQDITYYDRPVIHKPHWGWLIITYFFLGGLSGACYLIGLIADLVRFDVTGRLGKVCRYISLSSLIPCPVLLILDLKRPERFHHMLRVLKLRSPMSVGTWVLSIFGLLSGAVTTADLLRNILPQGKVNKFLRALDPMLSLAKVMAGLPAMFMTFYTAVLLAATAVPVWTKRAATLPLVFVSSSFSSALAVTSLVTSITKMFAVNKALVSLQLWMIPIDFIVKLFFERTLAHSLRFYLTDGRLKLVNLLGVRIIGEIFPLSLLLITRIRKANNPWIGRMSSLMILLGALASRYVVVKAGEKSAVDPKAVFEITR